MLGSGCSLYGAGRFAMDSGAYVVYRVADALDMVSFEAGLGPGAFANVQCTRLVQLGGGCYGPVYKSGYGKVSAERATLSPFPAGLHRMVGMWEESRWAVNAVIPGASSTTRKKIAGNVEELIPPEDETPLSIFDPAQPATEVGLDVHLLFVGAGAGVNLVEVADFLLGFAFIDIMGDDGFLK